jgi:hypothetical protein
VGYILDLPTEAGGYSVEVRRESFYLVGADDLDGEHAIYVYPDPYPDGHRGAVEIELRDIPKVRACLDAIEKYLKENR